jgi:hypothetical protein
VLKATGEHPFWTRDRGWIATKDLHTGEELLKRSGGWVRVVAVRWNRERVAVYNFEVGGFHTYFVGSQGVWVHNTCFPDAKALAKIFNISKDGWHRTVKPDILKDAGNFMKQIGSENPDIGVDAAGKILLRNPQTGKSVVTDLLADWFVQ